MSRDLLEAVSGSENDAWYLRGSLPRWPRKMTLDGFPLEPSRFADPVAGRGRGLALGL